MCPSQRDIARPATTLRQAFLLGMDSPFTSSSFLFITLSHPGALPSGKPSSRLRLQLWLAESLLTSHHHLRSFSLLPHFTFCFLGRYPYLLSLHLSPSGTLMLLSHRFRLTFMLRVIREVSTTTHIEAGDQYRGQLLSSQHDPFLSFSPSIVLWCLFLLAQIARGFR